MTTTAPRNVLLIVTDQQIADSYGALGNPHLSTPNLDRFVAEGTVFEKCYCAEPVCGPSRAAFLTGRMPLECGVYRNGHNVRSTIPNLGQWLRRAGAPHTPAYAGKWHIRETHSAYPPGFDMLASGVNCQGQPSDASVTFATEGFIRNHNSDTDPPFVLSAMYTQPHDICEWIHYVTGIDEGRFEIDEEVLPPLPESFSVEGELPAAMERQQEKQTGNQLNWTEFQWRIYLWGYYRMIEQVDSEVGRVLDALDETGLAENTLVIFCSDHGEGVAERRMQTKNFLFDSAARVPFALRLPGVVPAGKRESQFPISLLDIFPTIADFLGLEAPSGLKGRSLMPFVEMGRAPDRAFVAAQVLGGQGHMIRTERYKYITFRKDPVELLFDMKADPGETRNLAARPEQGPILEAHRAHLLGWLASLEIAPSVPAEFRFEPSWLASG